MGNDFLTMFLSNWYVIFALVILVIASCVLFVRNLSITRMKELTLPSNFGKLKKMELRGIEESVKVGALDKTTDFIMDTVIPYIKTNYIISDYVGIGGSSAGGATAQYIGVKYNKFFKFICCFLRYS